MFFFFTIFFTIYATINFYIFIRGWQALNSIPALKPFYLVLFLIAASSYILAKVLSTSLPKVVYDVMLWVGSFWFAYILYLFLAIVFIDAIRLVNWKFDIYPLFVKQNFELTKRIIFFSVFGLSTAIIFFGFLNTRNLKIKTLEIEIPKGNSELAELNIVSVSDIHLSPMNGENLLSDIVNSINSLNPDVVLMPGDIVDDKAVILKERNIGGALKSLKAKYGVFASNGNHEFISGIGGAAPYLRENNIHLLEDSVYKVENSFYVIGRDDRSKSNFAGKSRKALQEIITAIDKDLPMILLDHTPLNLEEAEQNNIALQLSGHTHHGQMFPASLITKMIYEVSWGYKKKGSTNFYVSCGVGTWGPPVRIGSDSEIVQIKVKLK
ncbi:MAG: metallophosphoesterase [Ignavibacteriales bacterium]|nr:MAG: metallophosphoesterase [Ignavibacteriales bacterium]